MTRLVRYGNWIAGTEKNARLNVSYLTNEPPVCKPGLLQESKHKKNGYSNMQHASSNPSSFVVWCRRQYVEASNSQTVEVLGLTDLTVFIPAHPTEIVQFVDGNFTILLQIPRDETSKKLVPCGQLGSECFMKFSLSVLHLIILKHVFLISHTSLQVNYCRIVEGQLEHWPLTQNVMLVLFLFVQSGHIASNLVPHLDSA